MLQLNIEDKIQILHVFFKLKRPIISLVCMYKYGQLFQGFLYWIHVTKTLYRTIDSAHVNILYRCLARHNNFILSFIASKPVSSPEYSCKWCISLQQLEN